jgi:hypothetical protein
MARELVPHRRVVPPATLDHEHLTRMLHDHMAKIEHMIKKMQRDIPVIVDEYLYMQNATSLSLLPQSQNLEMITGIFVVCTAAGGGTLTLPGRYGLRTIPINQGNTFLPVGTDNNGLILNNGDARTLTQGTAGLLGLELFGVEIPDKGVF